MRDPHAGDVLRSEVRQALLDKISAGVYDVAVLTPPCNTFSRLLFANSRGPAPLRSAAHPRGFPWLEGSALLKCTRGNYFFDLAAEAAGRMLKVGGFFLIEHPEDLGRTCDGEHPASIWQFPETHQLLAKPSVATGALHQCDRTGTGMNVVDYAKPTRLLGNLPALVAMKFSGMPRFDSQGGYLGPLPRSCGHTHKLRLTSGPDRVIRSASSAAYPSEMCKMLAEWILQAGPRRALPEGEVSSTSQRSGAPL